MRLNFVLLLILLCPLSQAELQLAGYLKSYAVYQEQLNIHQLANSPSPSKFESQNGLRLMADYFVGDNAAIELHYEFSPVLRSVEQNTNTLGDSANEGGYRISDIAQTLGSSEPKKANYFQNLDRLNIQLNFDFADVTLGRQAITLGAARVINPSDVFLPFDVRTFNQEYRIGIDAIRVQKSLGALTELDFGFIAGTDAKASNSAVFFQGRSNFSGSDISATVMRFAQQELLGVGLETALGDFGLWFEAAQVWGEDDYLRASIGLDYAITGNLFAFMEYHYNGAGSSDSKDYLKQLSQLPYRQGGVFLLGQHYLIPNISWSATPLLKLNGSALFNLNDKSSFINLSAEYSLSDNLYSDVSVYIFSGHKPELTTTDTAPFIPSLQLQSEYGSSPKLMYVSLRYYF